MGMIDTLQSARQLYSGRSVLSGTVSRLGVAGPHRVRLHERQSGAIIGVTTSGTDGAYSFDNLSTNYSYCVVGYDDGEDPVNAAVSDYVTPEVPADEPRLFWPPQSVIPSPDNLTTWTLAQASAAQDQTGISGGANGATTLTDATTTGQGRALSANTADIAPGTHCWRAWFKKDPTATTFIPELQAVVNGAFLHSVQVNLASGQVTGTSQYGVRDGAECGYPDWWIVAVGYTTTGTAPLAARVFASRRVTLGGDADDLAVGSAVIGWVDILTNTTPTEALAIVPYY